MSDLSPGPARRSSMLVLVLATVVGGDRARAGDPPADAPRPGLLSRFHRGGTPVAVVPAGTGPAPATAAEIAQRIDHAAESIRNDGLVVLKQPDVFSQARMTKYRREFEDIMTKEKDNFKVILAGRVARVDSAALDSQSSLGAALAPPGSTVAVPTPPSSTNPPVLPALTGQFPDPRFNSTVNLGRNDLNLGLEPNSVLDEEKSYLDRLHQIRRVNLGNDIADSAGYGLYLIRMPVSITPGECTVKGHGAEATVTVKHEFPPNFLPSTFRNLVINDLVDQLSPPIYEVVRARVAWEQENTDLANQAEALATQGEALLADLGAAVIKAGQEGRIKKGRLSLEPGPIIPQPGGGSPLPEPLGNANQPPAQPGAVTAADLDFDDLVDRLTDYLIRTGVPIGASDSPAPRIADGAVTDRLSLLFTRWKESLDRRISQAGPASGEGRRLARLIADSKPWQDRNLDKTRSGPRVVSQGDQAFTQVLIEANLREFFSQNPAEINAFAKFVRSLYATALPDDVALINRAFGIDRVGASAAAVQGAEINLKLAVLRARQQANFSQNLKTLRLPSDRIAKRSYPITPREIVDFFLEANLEAIAGDIKEARPTTTVRASDIRSYLRQQLSVAYDLMSRPSPKVGAALAPLDDPEAMDEILGAIHRRAFVPGVIAGDGLSLFEVYHQFIGKLANNLDARPLGGLCWAVAVDAVLLDEALREQAAVVLQTAGLPCPDWASLRFYHVAPELAEPAMEVFNDYVTHRWPLITFALDPVVDQQNILDDFSLRRDLQLALSFAFSTGKINFNQLTTFRRKIQQDEETIALNKTITSFAHGNETFGWRITPRFQTPPTQGNLATIGSTLLRGGPGPNYGLRKSKIEPGQRELVAVVIMPSFLPTIRVESSGNWFRLDDPEHLEVRTKRMLEQGRRVHELKQEVASACDAARYRPADIRHLRTKIDQLDAMLPIQSRVVPLPYDNAAAGFDLFTEGTTALVPELNGFEGADAVRKGEPTDLFVYGKFISIHETRVIAGGRELRNREDDNTGFEILSREVIRVRLPGDVQPSLTQDRQPYVEIYLATPNGISNRLFVPYDPRGQDVGSSPPPKDDPIGTVETRYEAVRKQFPPKSFMPVVEPVPAKDQPRDAGKAVLETTPRAADSTRVQPQPVSSSGDPSRAARVAPADEAIPVSLRPAQTPAVSTRFALQGAAPASNPTLPAWDEQGDLPLRPMLGIDPALVRSSLTAPAIAPPAAVVLPTPIVVLPPAAAKPHRRTILSRALDRLLHDKDRELTPRR